MKNVRTLSLIGSLLVLTGGTYLGWATLSVQGYAAAGRALKAQYGIMTMPHSERQSLRKLAMMKAAGTCKWVLNDAVWERVYRLYIPEDHSVRAAVYTTLLDEQERYFRADADQRRCQAAWARFGTAGADVRGILRDADVTEPAASANVIIGVSAEAEVP